MAKDETTIYIAGEFYRSLPALEFALRDWKEETAIKAAQVLGRIGDPSSLVALEESVLRDWRPNVIDCAKEAIENIHFKSAEGKTPCQTL